MRGGGQSAFWQRSPRPHHPAWYHACTCLQAPTATCMAYWYAQILSPWIHEGSTVTNGGFQFVWTPQGWSWHHGRMDPLIKGWFCGSRQVPPDASPLLLKQSFVAQLFVTRSLLTSSHTSTGSRYTHTTKTYIFLYIQNRNMDKIGTQYGWSRGFCPWMAVWTRPLRHEIFVFRIRRYHLFSW